MIFPLCAILFGLSSLHAKDEFTYQQYISCASNPLNRFWRYGFNAKDIMDVDLNTETVVAVSDEGNFMAKERQSKGYFKRKEIKLTRICSAVESVFLQSNNSLSRTVKPSVRVFSEKLDGEEYLVCAVQDFSPNTIKVRWVYRGKNVYFGSTTTGLLPQKDGTFQMSSYLSLGNWTHEDIVCETEHISFEGKLQVMLEDKNSANILHVIGLSILSFLLPILIPVGVTACISRVRKTSHSSVEDSLEQSSDDNMHAASVGLMESERATCTVHPLGL